MKVNKSILAFLLLLLASMSVTAYAQYKFEVRSLDFDKIQRDISDPGSLYYYPKLVKWFNSNDTVMNFEAYRDLYYGFLFQEDYDPFRQTEFEGKEEVEQLYYKDKLTRDECDMIERYAVKALEDNIFDIDQITYYIYALKQKNKHARAAVRQYRLDKLIAAIMSSGHGTKDDPWVVIFPEHEYTIVNFLGYVAKDHIEQDNGVDCVKAESETDSSKKKDFYFDVEKMLRVAAQKHPEDF